MLQFLLWIFKNLEKKCPFSKQLGFEKNNIVKWGKSIKTNFYFNHHTETASTDRGVINVKYSMVYTRYTKRRWWLIWKYDYVYKCQCGVWVVGHFRQVMPHQYTLISHVLILMGWNRFEEWPANCKRLLGCWNTPRKHIVQEIRVILWFWILQRVVRGNECQRLDERILTEAISTP